MYVYSSYPSREYIQVPIPGVKTVIIYGKGKLEIQQGEIGSIEIISIGSDELDVISYEENTNTLTLFDTLPGSIYRITVQNLDRVSIFDATCEFRGRVQFDRLEITADSSPSITARNIHAHILTTIGKDHSTFVLEGEVKNHSITLSDGSLSDSFSLLTQTTKVELTGSSVANVWAVGDLSVQCDNKKSRVNYIGHPEEISSKESCTIKPFPTPPHQKSLQDRENQAREEWRQTRRIQEEWDKIAERKLQKKQEKIRLEQERMQRELLEREMIERARLEREMIERARLEREMIERARLEREVREKEAKDREQALYWQRQFERAKKEVAEQLEQQNREYWQRQFRRAATEVAEQQRLQRIYTALGLPPGTIPTAYQVLGVAPDATGFAIRQAQQNLLDQWSPFALRGDPFATEVVDFINAAYEEADRDQKNRYWKSVGGQ